MRFTENGPSIPDSLLHARDEGRVVLFCGAGVSRARAGLPDFFGLAESVICKLGVTSESYACKVLNKARELETELDVTGLMSADRVFSLLEREFTTADIQSAVAECLTPRPDVDRSAHEILLRLARTPSGQTRIVTTNFDRLFESEAGRPRIYQPPRLPDRSQYEDSGGIVYLHGRVNIGYTGADGEGFVLSSSDFGHAYLSEGWATNFFRDIVRDYVVLFIGYSADDPPVHYLLEGLRRRVDSRNPIYAFQADESAELIARWQHKNVEAIPYSSENCHYSLWETLTQWAIRADDPRAWRQSVVNRSMVGPRQTEPHERGQVAHVVSTREGARAFAESKPPAEWLCVFDPVCRYISPARRNWMDLEAPVADPFALYGLDADSVPQRGDDAAESRSREVPVDAWDAFALNETDRRDLSPENFATVRGFQSSHMPRLPSRLTWIGEWTANVADQPAAVWWAARQESLHPGYWQRIEWKLLHSHPDIDAALRKLWGYILEAWQTSSTTDARREWYELKRELDRDGWAVATVRRFTTLLRPYLKVGPPLLSGPFPPERGDDCRDFELARIEVECPGLPPEAEIPDEWLHHIVRGLRSNLEAAIRLCDEVDDKNRLHISPINADEHPDVSNYQRTHGVSGCVITFARLFDQLVKVDLRRAREEFAAWPSDDDTAFARLRLWASGKPELATPHAFSLVVRGLSNDVFWDGYHQRDLLLVLASRWRELSIRDRGHLELRLLRGPDQWEYEDDESYRDHRASAVQERLQWLTNHQCTFSFDFEREMAALREEAPAWRPGYADHATDSREIRGGYMVTDTECGPLTREPLDSVLSKALELAGRSDGERLRQRDPFAGLCAEFPKRAYLALTHAARRSEYPEWAWSRFLNSSNRDKDTSSFSAIIAARLCRMPVEGLSELLHAATRWFQRASKGLSKEFPESFDRLVQRFIDVVKDDPANASSTVLGSSRGRDWAADAINSPVGHMVRTILEDERIDQSVPDTITPCLRNIERCLALAGDQRRHAIAMTSHYLGWLHLMNREWTEEGLLSILDAADGEDRAALWAGFFWNPKITSPEMYLRMRERLLDLAKQRGSVRQGHVRSLADLILYGWISSRPGEARKWVTDAEFRDVLLHGDEEFRSHVLWLLERALRDDDPTECDGWRIRAIDFFRSVWPRQKTVKTSKRTVQLCQLLLSRVEVFSALIDVVLPLLTKLADGTGLHIHFGSDVSDLVKVHSEQYLRLLCTILPDDAQKWPYEVVNTLEMIAGPEDALRTDARLIELRHKWNAR